MKKNRKGFTLAELLIVVAIIAVLVAIAIPVFTTQLERSRETTDMANLRSAYAAGTTAALTGFVGNNPIDTSTGSTLKYQPSADGALAATGAAIGQGTAQDGKADTTTLPGGCSYSNNTVAKGKQIAVTIANGVVTAVNFEQ